MIKVISQLLLLLAATVVSAAAPASLSLRGHLDKEQMEAAAQQIRGYAQSPPEKLLVEISSNSGDLISVLEVAKALYELRSLNKTHITVFLDDSVIGPAAAVAFAGDEIVCSVFVSWGDVQFGSANILPPHVLRSRVGSLARTPELQAIAEAMSAPSKGDTAMVLNQNDLRAKGLVTGTMSVESFRLTNGLVAAPPQPQAFDARDLASGQEITLFDRLYKAIPFESEKPYVIGRIKIEKDAAISQATYIYVKQALDHYKETKPLFIILDLNTPGGEVFAAQRISDALKEMDSTYNIPVVAYINNWAISAGAMLAYSCRFIVIAKDAAMGAAEPIMVSGNEMQTASEKVNSALRADFGNRANFFDRNADLAEAMVDKDIILVWRHGRVVRLEKEEQVVSTGPEPDEVISAKGKLLTLTAQQMMKYGVADIVLEPKGGQGPDAAEVEAGRWPVSKEALFTHPYFKRIALGVVEPHSPDWKAQFFAFLAHPAVASFLFLGMMIGFYIEINTPGFGIPGTIGITCLLLIILSSMAVEAASWLEVIIILAGLILIGVEVLILPGFGFPGILGIFLVIGGLVAITLPSLGDVNFEIDTQTLNAAGEEFVYRLAWLCGAFVVGLAIIAYLARSFSSRMHWFGHLVSQGEEEASAGYVAGIKPAEGPELGAEGVTRSMLRYSGKVEIGNKIYDALADSQFIDVGVRVKVIQIRGGHVVVIPIEEDK